MVSRNRQPEIKKTEKCPDCGADVTIVFKGGNNRMELYDLNGNEHSCESDVEYPKHPIGQTVVGKTITIIFGEVDDVGIETVYVERYNLTLRHGISRLVRKSLCFSKCKEMLDNHLDVYQCYNNLIRVNSALTIETDNSKKNIERTPCMAEGITDHVWTWKELLMSKVSINY